MRYTRPPVLRTNPAHQRGIRETDVDTDALARTTQALRNQGFVIDTAFITQRQRCAPKRTFVPVSTVLITLQSPALPLSNIALPHIRTELGEAIHYHPSARQIHKSRGTRCPLWRRLTQSAPTHLWNPTQRWTQVYLCATDPIAWLAQLALRANNQTKRTSRTPTTAKPSR